VVSEIVKNYVYDVKTKNRHFLPKLGD